MASRKKTRVITDGPEKIDDSILHTRISFSLQELKRGVKILVVYIVKIDENKWDIIGKTETCDTVVCKYNSEIKKGTIAYY